MLSSIKIEIIHKSHPFNEWYHLVIDHLRNINIQVPFEVFKNHQVLQQIKQQVMY